jgi:hypothetical protein
MILVPGNTECYDEETLFKVRDALREVLLEETLVSDCINEMQGRGILFRERVQDIGEPDECVFHSMCDQPCDMGCSGGRLL